MYVRVDIGVNKVNESRQSCFVRKKEVRLIRQI